MASAARQLVAQNRRARHDYFIEDSFEAGIVLTGSEVKAIRAGKVSIGEAHAHDMAGELYLLNAHIGEYEAASRFGHEPRRPRKLLLHRREVARLMGLMQREGYTLVPLSLYFNERGIAKLELGLAKGKRKVDKRETKKEQDWQRQRRRLLRERA